MFEALKEVFPRAKKGLVRVTSGALALGLDFSSLIVACLPVNLGIFGRRFEFKSAYNSPVNGRYWLVCK